MRFRGLGSDLFASPFASLTLVLHAASTPSRLLGVLLLGVQVGVEQPRGLLLGAGHQVPITVQSDRDARMAHKRREGLRVQPGGDHQAGECVPALVGRDPVQARLRPCGVGAVLQVLAVEGIRRRPAEEQVVSFAAGGKLVLDEVVAQLRGDRHPAATSSRLQLDRTFLLVPAPLDPDHSGGEIHIAHSQRLQLASA
jgi:hypothetical protein